MLLILWLLTPVQATDRPLGAMAEAPSNNVGYMLPEFDLQGLSSNKEEQEFYMVPLPSKLSKFNSDLGTGASTSKETGKDKGRSRHDAETGLKDEEELALRLLGRKCKEYGYFFFAIANEPDKSGDSNLTEILESCALHLKVGFV
ncbi:hypothetical protein CVT25_008996 [Psilocybe cyanescens]|uniref:Uncharacterized protein n=1 Tax=Psilocybe cyanescens TaxID=93625 RepID=A0A409XN64_PSICY|nr:hypothetical protein CVT25_008996 [Psilocybe cyanescens]